MIKSAASEFWREEGGASAPEFAVVASVFIGVVFMLINVCVAIWAQSALNFTVETAARCLSVRPAVCDTVSDAIKQQPYMGPSISPTFGGALAGACGNKVTGSGTYVINGGLISVPVHMSATSCYPAQS
jgi:Flp pilus assembly protein TadG